MNGEKEAVRKSLKIAFASLHFAKVNRPSCYDCLCARTFGKVDYLDNQSSLVTL